MAKFRLGILGGGQLARMSVVAAQRMGVDVISLDEDPDSPAAQVGRSDVGSIHSANDIAKLMKKCDFITFENEFIKAGTLREACEISNFDPKHIVPGIDTLETIQDKYLQRQAYLSASVPSPQAVPAHDAGALGFPCVLKARYGGYDGKGTRYAKSKIEYTSLKSLWGDGGWLAEEFVEFTQELAVMVVSCSNGELKTFPVMVTEQSNHVCDLVYPCLDEDISKRAREVAIAAVKSLNGKGLFGVELFLHTDRSISVNEIAPRPHNTGHYTLDWGGTSQFEAHVLSALGVFSEVHSGVPTCMANVLGVEGAGAYDVALDSISGKHPEARMHWYGKRQAKPGRKMGHINVNGVQDIRAAAQSARSSFYERWMQS